MLRDVRIFTSSLISCLTNACEANSFSFLFLSSVEHFMRRCQEIRATYKDHILRWQAVRCVLFWLGVWQVWTPRDASDHHAGSVYCLPDWKFLSELRHVCRPEGSPWNLQWRWDKQSKTVEMTREWEILHRKNRYCTRYFATFFGWNLACNSPICDNYPIWDNCN